MRSIKEMDKRLDEREQEIERQKEVINGMIENEEKYLLEINKLQEDIGNYVNIVLHERKEIDRLHSIIKEVREYIENNSLYEQDYDYDYEENLYEYPPSDEQARKDILSILDKENK